jgi:hypothetical protein
LTVRKKGGELILSKKHPSYSREVQKKAKKHFLVNSKIPDCGQTSAARKLKKEMNVWT